MKKYELCSMNIEIATNSILLTTRLVGCMESGGWVHGTSWGTNHVISLRRKVIIYKLLDEFPMGKDCSQEVRQEISVLKIICKDT